MGSAWGETLTVIALGLGAATGAVYVAVDTVALPPAGFVAATVSVPQLAPPQPAPDSVHVSTVLGVEPGTGVSVATNVAMPLAGTSDGATSCKEKLLLMLTETEICFDGSAMLCAVIVTFSGMGKICGAV
ncbi:MAG: hypothetical protein NVS9B4_26170 [Candidatus Acidiferrum sp.]